MKLNVAQLPEVSPIHVLWGLRNEIVSHRMKGMRGITLELGLVAKRNIVQQLCEKMSVSCDDADTVTITEIFGMHVKQVDCLPSQFAYIMIEDYLWAVLDTDRGSITKVTIDVLSLDGLNWKH